jgi:hypothetical protein
MANMTFAGGIILPDSKDRHSCPSSLILDILAEAVEWHRIDNAIDSLPPGMIPNTDDISDNDDCPHFFGLFYQRGGNHMQTSIDLSMFGLAYSFDDPEELASSKSFP